jgi:hypothetical protein
MATNLGTDARYEEVAKGTRVSFELTVTRSERPAVLQAVANKT